MQRSTPISTSLADLQTIIRQQEDAGLMLTSVTQGVDPTGPCNVATFVARNGPLPQVDLLPIPNALKKEQDQQNYLANLQQQGYTLICFSSVYDSGTLIDIAAARCGVVNAAATPAASGGCITLVGKMSQFGGPKDKDVGATEGLALVEPTEIGLYPNFFLTEQEAGYPGLARRLNTKEPYIACRWDYHRTPRSFLQKADITVTANGKSIVARAIDWGPNVNTGRVADLSPCILQQLGLQTDDLVTVTIPLP